MSAWTPTMWRLHCAWCSHSIYVSPRGGRGKDQGAGVEAATLMERHVHYAHDKTWPEFLAADSMSEPEAAP